MLICLIISTSFSFWNSIGDQARDFAEGAAVADASIDLLETAETGSEIINNLEKIEKFAGGVERKLNDSIYIENETKSLMKGSNLTSDRLSSNIRYTSSYIRRLRRLIMTVTTFGADAATAINTLETNVSLAEIQKNQQAQMLEQRQQRLVELNHKLEQEKKWEDFLSAERRNRWGQ